MPTEYAVIVLEANGKFKVVSIIYYYGSNEKRYYSIRETIQHIILKELSLERLQPMSSVRLSGCCVKSTYVDNATATKRIIMLS